MKYFLTVGRKFIMLLLIVISITGNNLYSNSSQQSYRLYLAEERANNVKYNKLDDNIYKIKTTGKNPFFYTKALESNINIKNHKLTFKYHCLQGGLNSLRFYFGPPFKKEQSKVIRTIGEVKKWATFSINLNDYKSWGKVDDVIKIETARKNITLYLKDIKIRPLTAQEKEQYISQKIADRKKRKNLKNYLSTNYKAKINHITVKDSLIIVEGKIPDGQQLYLCEVPPYIDVTEANSFETALTVKETDFKIKVDRYIDKNNIQYDRLLSKWILMEKDKKSYKIKSNAHYQDTIKSDEALPDYNSNSKGKKGIEGLGIERGHLEDLKKLNISYGTINFNFGKFMYTDPGPNRIKHTYNGESFYFGRESMHQLDSTIKVAAKNNMIMSGLILADRFNNCPDSVIGKALQHPDMDLAGLYTMPDMTNAKSVNIYAAAVDFLVQRYSRPDKKYGRIHNWIIHNEVNSGWVWTNMGKKSEIVFMDTYLKSMRLCYNIARKYNPNSEVFISLDRNWTKTHGENFYASKKLLELLLDYTEDEGDFKWGIAHHPYPEKLSDPKTWLDKNVDFTYSTPMITFKNIEVLDSWMKRAAMLYKGKNRRSLWLSEAGINSPSYSKEDLRNQAAGCAYAWKKIKYLQGVDAFCWHGWFDMRGEFGLKLGLRRFPDAKHHPGGKKPVWSVFEAAGTDNEDKVFAPYKKVIGIDNWKEIRYKGDINQE
jgi:hypothetical protein